MKTSTLAKRSLMLKAPPGDEILQALGAVGENDAEHEPMKGLGEGVMGCKLYL